MRNSVNIPAFEKEKEFQVSGEVRPQSHYFSPAVIEPQTAYAVSSHLGVYANGYYGFTMPDVSTVNHYKANHLDAGIGYLKSFNSFNKMEAFVTESMRIIKLGCHEAINNSRKI